MRVCVCVCVKAMLYMVGGDGPGRSEGFGSLFDFAYSLSFREINLICYSVWGIIQMNRAICPDLYTTRTNQTNTWLHTS